MGHITGESYLNIYLWEKLPFFYLQHVLPDVEEKPAPWNTVLVASVAQTLQQIPYFLSNPC
jgi:hypothetical protein